VSVENTNQWEPKIIVFACNWCTYAAADLAGLNRLEYPAEVRIIRTPCSGRMDPMFVLRAFNRGADGVLLSG
jgi:coenzyme F420-reducing hydrogenase delta subunit